MPSPEKEFKKAVDFNPEESLGLDYTDMEMLHKLCRLRSSLEAFAVSQHRKQTGRLDDEVDGQLTKLLEKLYWNAVRGDYSKFHETDTELHFVLISSCGIPALEKCWKVVLDDLDSWIQHVQKVYWPSLMALYREHTLLLEAWNSHDDWVAQEATHQHLEAGWYRVAATQEKLDPKIDPVDRTVSFISTHFASQIDVEWIARNVSYVSASHLNRLFRKKLGVSLKAYLKQVRMERAAELLSSSSETISTITHRVGYKNVSHFVRDFGKHFNRTPAVYRQQAQNE